MIYFRKKKDDAGLHPHSFEKIKGVRYLTEAEARDYARKTGVAQVRDSEGTVVIRSAFFATAGERKKAGAMKILVGEHAGRRVGEVPGLLDTVCDPETYKG